MVLRWYDKLASNVTDVVTDTYDSVANWVDNTIVSPINTWVDNYVWDTSNEVAKLEGYISDAVGVAEETVFPVYNDVIANVNQWVDDYIYDSTEQEAWVEEQVNNFIDVYMWNSSGDEAMLEETIKDIIGGAGGVANTAIDQTKDTVDDIIEEAEEVVDDVIVTTSDIIKKVYTTTEIINTIIEKTPIDWAFEPLALVFGGLVDSVAERLEAFIANSFGIERK